MTEYVCAICLKPIVDQDPHTVDETGEDCHAECCPTCLIPGVS